MGYEKKGDIEKTFGGRLLWQRLNEKKTCRIACRLENVDGTNVEQWETIKAFHCDAMTRFYNALKMPLIKAAKSLK